MTINKKQAVLCFIFMLSVMVCFLFFLTKAEAEYDYYEKMNAFIHDDQWKNGAAWGGETRPKESGYSSKGCAAYCADFSYVVWNVKSSDKDLGPTVGKKYTNAAEVCAGDIIKCYNYTTKDQHWYVVLERYPDGSLWTAERSGTSIRMGRKYYSVGHLNTVEGVPFDNGWHMPGYTPYSDTGSNPVWVKTGTKSTQIHIGEPVEFYVNSNVYQGLNGSRFEMYIWDSVAYQQGTSGTWVGVSGTTAKYTFTQRGTYYVRGHVYNSNSDIYSEPLIVYVSGSDPEWVKIRADSTQVNAGVTVQFTVESNVKQGQNGTYFDMYIWDSVAYQQGTGGTWVGVSGTTAKYTFTKPGTYYVRGHVYNSNANIYSDPLIIHVSGSDPEWVRVSTSSSQVYIGNAVQFSVESNVKQGQNGCYFDMYVWDSMSYEQGTGGTWVGVSGTTAKYTFTKSGVYYVRGHVYNSNANIYSDPIIIYVSTPSQGFPENLGDDFYGVILNTACWKPISRTDESENIYLKKENGKSGQVWRFQRQKDNSYVITSCYDGYSLEMTAGTRENGVQITTNVYSGKDYQKWYIYTYGNGRVLQNKYYTSEEWVLDLRNNAATDGTAIQIRKRDNSASQIWSIYTANDVQLSGPILQVDAGDSLSETSFSWSRSYGSSYYDLKIYKDKLNDGEEYSVSNLSFPNCSFTLPAGTYYAYVTSVNYYKTEVGPTVSFTVDDGVEQDPRYTLTIKNNVTDPSGIFSDNYTAGTEISLSAEKIPGYLFDHWSCSAGTIADISSQNTLFTMQASDTIIYCYYQKIECNLTINGNPEQAAWGAVYDEVKTGTSLPYQVAYSPDSFHSDAPLILNDSTSWDCSASAALDAENRKIFFSGSGILNLGLNIPYDLDYGYSSNSWFFLVIGEDTLRIPNSVFTIEEEAFANTAASIVIIPDSVKTIGSNAFPNVKVVMMNTMIPRNIANDAFPNVIVYAETGNTFNRQMYDQHTEAFYMVRRGVDITEIMDTP